MRDFKGTPLSIGDKVIFTDSFSRLLEGTITGFKGNLIFVSASRNMTGHVKAVRHHAVFKLDQQED